MVARNTIIVAVLTIIPVVCSLIAEAQNQVYYYERVKIVANGHEKASSGDGHYIAVNEYGLYECDANGSTKNCGFVKRSEDDGQQNLFEGKAYLGNDLYFIFNADYSRLNIYLDANTIYVYTRRQTPSSQSALRVYKSSASQPSPNVPSESGESNAGRQSKQLRTCSLCHGTGTQVRQQSVSTIPETHGKKKWCGECNTNVSLGHYHIRCTLCGGRGYLE